MQQKQQPWQILAAAFLALVVLAPSAGPAFQSNSSTGNDPRVSFRDRRCDSRYADYRGRVESDLRVGSAVETAQTGQPAREEAAPRVLKSLASSVNIDTMISDLSAISDQIATRYYSTTGMQKATEYAYQRLSATGLDRVYYDSFRSGGSTIRNVVGVKKGAVYPDRIYMLCGHLDSISNQPLTSAPGAEDNGTGSVAVIEAARLLAPLKTDSTIYFALFTGEEVGYLGSYHLADTAWREGWDLRGVLNMDMIGYDVGGTPALLIEGFPRNNGSVALLNRVEEMARTHEKITMYRYNGEGWGSDHEAFDEYGFPAMLAIDYDWDVYPCYHRTCDEIENVQPLQLQRMTAVVTMAGADLAGLRCKLGSVQGVADKSGSSNDAGIHVEVAGTRFADATSGRSGAFVMRNLLPGSYVLRASAHGYKTTSVAVTVADGASTRVRIQLKKSAS